jgi:hypothetical protein
LAEGFLAEDDLDAALDVLALTRGGISHSRRETP